MVFFIVTERQLRAVSFAEGVLYSEVRGFQAEMSFASLL